MFRNGKTTRRQFLASGAAAGAAFALPSLVSAQSTKSLRPITLQSDWIWGGPNAGFIVAKEKGFYADEGAYKTLVEQDSGRILGAHLVGPHADEVINLFGLAIRHGLTVDDIKTTMFAYPTGASDIGYML